MDSEAINGSLVTDETVIAKNLNKSQRYLHRKLGSR